MTLAQQSGPLAVLSEWAVSMGAFRRNRMPVEKKVVAAALCNGGYSYREVARLLGGMSYIAARDAYLSMVTSLHVEERKQRREVAIGTTSVSLDGRSFGLWLARDVDSGEILSFHASPTSSAEDANRFLASVASQCSNRPQLRLDSTVEEAKPFVNIDLYFQPLATYSLFDRIGRFLKVSSK